MQKCVTTRPLTNASGRAADGSIKFNQHLNNEIKITQQTPLGLNYDEIINSNFRTFKEQYTKVSENQ